MTHSGPRAQAPDASATYVFAVGRDTRAMKTADLTGLAGMPGGERVRLLTCGTLTAVVQTVPAADFTDEVWQLRLSDRQEIERYARAHHEVVSAAAAIGPAVPLPLATLYHDDERARRVLDDEAARFHGALKRIAHHAEWGVKVYASHAPPERQDPAQNRPVSTGAGRREAPAAGAGLAYLNRKRGVHEGRERRREEAMNVAQSVDAELREIAAAARRLRTHDAAPGEQRVHTLNATYLIAADRTDELMRMTTALRERTGAQIEVSGPWVPYSFVGEV
ncbi:GvpL/GvpF family gas vesicle protein [Streptomyces rectiviolaceus]|uniref:GvpL/GvpF family gas vesicle protein n=1 Tax=Streptomyces rectiviolaceus TaxID=332591 RepID=A0ABP6NAS6_9ACTN